MTTRYTMCPMNCHPTYCGMKATVEDDGKVRITSNAEHPESKGFLCQRGRQVHEIIDHPERLTRPLWRDSRNGDWMDVSWDVVLERLVQKLQSPHRTAIWLGHGAIVSDLNRPLLFHFADTLGIQVWNPAVLCWAAGAYGLSATGIVETNTKEDVAANSHFILLWGWNVASQPTTAPFILAAKKRGARVIAIDCRRSEARQVADEMFLVHPDTDAALALAMCHAILADGLANEEFIENYTLGFAEFAEAIKPYSPAWAAQLTGIPASTIFELARQYANSPASIILMGGSSMFKGQNGWLASRAIACLPALTGHVGKPGTGFGPRHRGFVKGLDYAAFTPTPSHQPQVPSHMEEMIKTLESGNIDTLFLFGTNFLSSFADARRVEAALAKVNCIVAYDLVMNQTMKRVADIVLPGTVWVEELGVKATDTYVYLMDRVRDPFEESRSISSLLVELAVHLGRPEAAPFRTQEEAINQLLKGLGPDVTVDSLRQNKGAWSRQAQHVGHRNHVFHTPSQKIEFASDLLESLGMPRLPIPQFDFIPQSQPEQLYPLNLRTGRSGLAFHSFYDEGKMLAKLYQREPQPVVWINTQDAKLRSIQDNSEVEVYNQKSVLRAKAFVSDAIVAGAVWMRDGWFGTNQLTDGTAPVPVTASEGLLPIQMPGGLKKIPGGQASYKAMVNVRVVPF